MHAINVDGYNLATFHLVKYTNDEEIQEYMDTSETKYKNICISCCMFSVKAAELSVPAELSRFWTNHEPGNKHMKGGIRMDSSLFSYIEDPGPLAEPRSSMYENEGEDAGASSPSHMRNYLATIDRLPAKRSAAGRWGEQRTTIFPGEHLLPLLLELFVPAVPSVGCFKAQINR